MARIRAGESAEIAAAPDAIYDIISDYRNKHPRILPKEHFSNLNVEAGGQGAGTVISFRLRAGGGERAYRMEVHEPEPGRVLAERDPTSGLVTTFTLTPLEGGKRTRVEIATEFDPSPGIMGLVERFVVPSTLRRVYAKELSLLDQVARAQEA